MLGSGGCIPADARLPRGASRPRDAAGAVCIADEVMTSRHGRSGLAALLGAEPDLRTFGKYIGGGFSFGAFGGRAEVIDQFDPRAAGRDPARRHVQQQRGDDGGGLRRPRRALSAEVAEAHTARGERFRAEVADVLGRHPLSVRAPDGRC